MSMTMKSCFIVLLAGFLVFGLLSCERQPTIKGSGTIVSENREVTDFSRLNLWGAGSIRITQGESESLEITCDDNFLPYIKTEVEGQTLHIGPDKVKLKGTQTIQYTVYLKSLEHLHGAGAMKIEAGELVSDKLSLAIDGACTVNVDDVQVANFNTVSNGASTITIANGQVQKQVVTFNGAGKYASANVQAQEVTITMNGAGKVTVWAKETLNAQINGVGKVDYYGSPKVTQQVAGVGRVKGLGAKPETGDPKPE